VAAGAGKPHQRARAADRAVRQNPGEAAARWRHFIACPEPLQALCSSTRLKEITMAKAYWVSAYRAIHDPEKLAAYAKLAGPAITSGGGRFLARGMPAEVYEAGVLQRVVLIEFDSLEQAKAAHDSPDYQAALEALGDGAERDLRFVEGA
jgi:uncharacterized protein (DUF1330 family)